ncbi:MAG: ASCH domain-containing protein [Candidatus Aenigmarchaeota archaeon]|nr:ASCH domain-containing protein [Candidatus Aenigmarchaeota archaeon]
MKKIHFSKEYKKKLLKGEKSSTIRLGKRKKYKVGDVVELVVEEKPIAKALITNVEYVRVKDLTEERAKKDGFHTKNKLIKALKKHYPRIKDNNTVTVIEFKIIKDGKKSQHGA